VGRRRVVSPGPVILEWDESEVKRFLAEPDGELGRTLMTAVGELVVKGAKRRALRRTGRMADEITFRVERDDEGLFTGIYSPARNPETGFPYPIVHEGRTEIIRDRRPHRSLRPALKDIRHIEARG
jgi:hypothetical protein